MLWKESGGVSETMSWNEFMKIVVICLLAFVPGIAYYYLRNWAYKFQRQMKEHKEDPIIGVMIPDYVLNYLQDYADQKKRELQEENDDRVH